MSGITSSFRANFSQASANSFKIDIIDFDPVELARVLSPFINQGSRPHFLTRDDIKVYKIKYKGGTSVPDNEKVNEQSDFSTLMSIGNNKFFDVLFYLSLDASERPAMSQIAEGSTLPAIPSGDICTALFVQYFFILTRGRVSNSQNSVQGSDMPKFLKAVLNCNDSPLEYMEKIASFDMHKMGYDWARHIPFNGMAREAVSRFGLGVAGYRMFSPFRVLKIREGLDENLVRASEIASQMAVASASWDLHPATRSNQILQTYGPLNANLGNLMLEVFDHNELNALVATKALFQMPVEDPSARQYRTWDVDYVPNQASNIFP